MPSQISLRFLGAAQNVTGSSYLLEQQDRRVLVDCGLYQERKYRERNWAPFWRIFNWERDEDGNEFSSFLWNTLRTEHTKESTKIELRPIIPLVSIESGETRSNFSLLGGLLGYSRKNSNKILRFLYIPVNISGGSSPPANASTAETMILGDV